MSNSKAIGAAYSDQNIDGADILASDDLIGFNAVAQTAVTQGTSKSTGVTANTSAGVITMHNASLNAATNVAFTLTNSKIGAKDNVIVTIANSGATAGAYQAWVATVAAGSCVIVLRNLTGGSLGEAVVLNFAVIRSR